jgi:hypothetical protein
MNREAALENGRGRGTNFPPDTANSVKEARSMTPATLCTRSGALTFCLSRRTVGFTGAHVSGQISSKAVPVSLSLATVRVCAG